MTIGSTLTISRIANIANGTKINLKLAIIIQMEANN